GQVAFEAIYRGVDVAHVGYLVGHPSQKDVVIHFAVEAGHRGRPLAMGPVRADVELRGLLRIESGESTCVLHLDHVAGAHVLPVVGEALHMPEARVPGPRTTAIVVLETQEAARERLALCDAAH